MRVHGRARTCLRFVTEQHPVIWLKACGALPITYTVGAIRPPSQVQVASLTQKGHQLIYCMGAIVGVCPKHGPMMWSSYSMGFVCHSCMSALNIITTTHTNQTLWNTNA